MKKSVIGVVPTQGLFLSLFVAILCTGLLGLLLIDKVFLNHVDLAEVAHGAVHFTGNAANEKKKDENMERSIDSLPADHATKIKYLWTDDEYECLGWRQTSECETNGVREPFNDRGCDNRIQGGLSGYCEIRNITSGEVMQVMRVSCNSLRGHVAFYCGYAKRFTNFKIQSQQYIHTPMAASFTKPNQLRKGAESRGIVINSYPKVILSTYAGIRLLREKGCILPIELWHCLGEFSANHPILNELVTKYNVVIRIIDSQKINGFDVKPFSLYYSSFDNVLLLDADNFVVRDPTYLFDTSEFQESGAMFWPDYWHPGNTIFKVNSESLLWELTGIPYVKMYEQESGQVLVNRLKHKKALDMLMFYTVHRPRFIRTLELTWGDKDLFRLAWMKTESSFHFIQKPPGSAGFYVPDSNIFCGVTIVQFDSNGEPVFFHRNQVKVSEDKLKNRYWTHYEEFTGLPFDMKIGVHNHNGVTCYGSWGQKKQYKRYNITTVDSMKNVESSILHHAQSASLLLSKTAPVETTASDE